MRSSWVDRYLAAVITVVCSLPVPAQFGYELDDSVPEWRNEYEFSFVRLIYQSDFFGRGRGRGGWSADWPDAEYHFMRGVKRLTSVDASGEGVYMTALDEALFDFPWLYALEVGSWALSVEEATNLREYLLRGGFLMIDDFHGGAEWAGFVAGMTRIFPRRAIVDIPIDDEAMHVLYDLDKRIQIPGMRALWQGQTWEDDGVTPHWRGIYDDEGRLMVAINHNMDIGDAWEHADTPGYPEPMTALAYRFGINYIIYAMTH